MVADISLFCGSPEDAWHFKSRMDSSAWTAGVHACMWHMRQTQARNSLAMYLHLCNTHICASVPQLACASSTACVDLR